MALSQTTTQRLLDGVEQVFRHLPRANPPPDVWSRARIVSHRGERDNRAVRENTLSAFDAAAGVWGLECDIRWTRDLQPVVAHDADLMRVFGQAGSIADIELDALRARLPQVPTLDEFIRRYAPRHHLMLELKAEVYPEPRVQRARLARLLGDLHPGRDFHILALDTRLFEHVQTLPATCWLPVARTNLAAMSAFALRHGCAGLAGPYALMTRRRIRLHHRAGQRIGVGFPAHRNVLRRELARGVDWIFSNHARDLQTMVDAARRPD